MLILTKIFLLTTMLILTKIWTKSPGFLGLRVSGQYWWCQDLSLTVIQPQERTQHYDPDLPTNIFLKCYKSLGGKYKYKYFVLGRKYFMNQTKIWSSQCFSHKSALNPMIQIFQQLCFWNARFLGGDEGDTYKILLILVPIYFTIQATIWFSQWSNDKNPPYSCP